MSSSRIEACMAFDAFMGSSAGELSKLKICIFFFSLDLVHAGVSWSEDALVVGNRSSQWILLLRRRLLLFYQPLPETASASEILLQPQQHERQWHKVQVVEFGHFFAVFCRELYTPGSCDQSSCAQRANQSFQPVCRKVRHIRKTFSVALTQT